MSCEIKPSDELVAFCRDVKHRQATNAPTRNLQAYALTVCSTGLNFLTNERRYSEFQTDVYSIITRIDNSGEHPDPGVDDAAEALGLGAGTYATVQVRLVVVWRSFIYWRGATRCCFRASGARCLRLHPRLYRCLCIHSRTRSSVRLLFLACTHCRLKSSTPPDSTWTAK